MCFKRIEIKFNIKEIHTCPIPRVPCEMILLRLLKLFYFNFWTEEKQLQNLANEKLLERRARKRHRRKIEKRKRRQEKKDKLQVKVDKALQKMEQRQEKRRQRKLLLEEERRQAEKMVDAEQVMDEDQISIEMWTFSGNRVLIRTVYLNKNLNCTRVMVTQTSRGDCDGRLSPNETCWELAVYSNWIAGGTKCNLHSPKSKETPRVIHLYVVYKLVCCPHYNYAEYKFSLYTSQFVRSLVKCNVVTFIFVSN